MPLLGFQKRFAELVETGKKRQTIRAYRKDGRDPKPGDTLYLYTGLRTKQSRKLGEAECLSVGEIEIGGRNPDGLLIGSVRGIEDEDLDRFARRDGLKDFAEMVEWFDKTHGLPFKGLLIRWGALRPAAVRGE